MRCVQLCGLKHLDASKVCSVTELFEYFKESLQLKFQVTPVPQNSVTLIRFWQSFALCETTVSATFRYAQQPKY